MRLKWETVWVLGLGLILAVYRLTSYPTISWVDSGVIAAAAKSLGVANPPGFPLYMLIGHLFSLIPLGSVVVRLQVLSHLGAMLAVAGVWWLVRKVVEGRWREWVAVSAAVAAAFSYSLWSQAGNVETFALTNGVLMTILVAGLELGERLEKKWRRGSSRWIWALSFLGGVSLGLNPVVSALAVAGVWWLVRYGEVVGRRRAVFGVAFALVILGGVGVYSYLPLRAMAKPFLDWGDPVNWERIQKHLVGAGLNIYEPETNSINGFTGQPKVWLESLLHFGELGVWQFTPLLVPLVVWGGWVVWRRKKDVFWPLLLMAGVNMVYVVLYYGGNQENWMITSWLMAAVFLGVGLNELLGIDRGYLRLEWVKRVLVVGVAGLPLVFWWPLVDHSRYVFADEYANYLYKGLPEGAVLIGGGDFFHSLTNYTHEVTGLRKDIIPVTGNMLYIFDWYREGLRKHSDLIVSAEAEEIVKMKSVDEFTELIDRLVADNPKKEFFITPLLLRDTVVAGTMEGNYHSQKFDLLPHGLVFKIVEKGSEELVNEELWKFDFKYPELMGGKPPYYLERNYKNAYKLLRSDYAVARVNLGDWYQQKGEKVKAEEYFKKAVEMGGGDTAEFLNRLAVFYAQEKRFAEAKSRFDEALLVAPENEGLLQNYQLFLQDAGLATPSGEIKKAEEEKWVSYATEGFTFSYPQTWKVFQSSGGVTILDEEDEFVIGLSKGEKKSTEAANEYILKQAREYGQLVDQGLARIPDFEYAWVRVWIEEEERKLEFFLFRGLTVYRVFVGPADSPKMAIFDRIVGTIK